MESPQERQENEIQALKAIFGNELEDLRVDDANGEWKPLDILLVLTPQQGSSGVHEIHAELRLRISCSKNYPDKPPQMSIVKSKGLSKSDETKLLKEIQELARKLHGEEMIFQVAQYVQSFLYKYNKPAFESFYEEMVQFRQEKEQQQKQRYSLQQQKERQAIQDEVLRKQEAIRAEGRQRRESLRHNSDQSNLPSPSDNLGDGIPDTKASQIQDFEIKTAPDLEPDEISDAEQDLKYVPNDPKSISRISSEFEILETLGEGAYGSVSKVRNKLDDRVYAIKKIELNPRNRQLNRKITREVKLLSRLNHENVVRYFNSWIESGTVDLTETSTNTNSSPGDVEEESKKVLDKLIAPVKGNIEWSVSCAATQEAVDSESDSDSDSDDHAGNHWLGFLSREESDSIVFENGSNASPPVDEETVDGISSRDEKDSGVLTSQLEIQFMYIQMEFCEKSTLRIAIDQGLCHEMPRVWRLFREIVEGLAHIHEQGMIHRDLKPVNIFLDFQDHVKIGDFGLATMSALPWTLNKERENGDTSKVLLRSPPEIQDIGDQSLTGHVGTALYVAPEINSSSTTKASYNQKVDIYSLGIIWFEMCYPPLRTSMERIKVLHNLRSKDIILPNDFPQDETPSPVRIIRWLLDHEPSRRPSSKELLTSDLLPPPELEEAELREMVRHTLNNSQSKSYKYLVESCLKQATRIAEDVTFDMAVLPKRLSIQRLLVLQDQAKDTIMKIFQRHGASCLSTPLLMPFGTQDLSKEFDSIVRLMTRAGGVVTIPHDLRVNFARYVVWNEVSFLKRYAIQRVYREKKVYGVHPRELYECAFDIVTPNTGSLLPDAELLAVVWEIICQLPGLNENDFYIRLNHTALVRAALLYSGIQEDRHASVLSMCGQAKDKKSLREIAQNFLGDAELDLFIKLLEVEGPFEKVASAFQRLTKRRGPAASLAKLGLHELGTTINYAKNLGVTSITLSPLLVHNIHFYSGIMCQLVCEDKNKRRHGGVQVIAAGGRYDALLAVFRQALDNSGMLRPGVMQYATGISLCLDKIIMLLHNSAEPTKAVDVVISSSGKNIPVESLTIARDLWRNGFKCLLLDNAQQELDDYCLEMSVPYTVLLKYTDPNYAKVRALEKERFNERRLLRSEVVENLQKNLRSTRETNEMYSSSQQTQRQDSKNMASGDSYTHSHAHSGRYSHSESQHYPTATVNYIRSEKMAASNRRRYENLIHNHIARVVQRFESRVRVEVLAVGGLDGSAIGILAGFLDLENEQEFNETRKTATEKIPKNKKYLTEVLDEIHILRFEKNIAVIILYSLMDNKFRVLT